MRNSIGILVFLLSIGCLQKDKSNTITYYKNTTSHKVEIYPYRDGIVDTYRYKQIKPYETITAFDTTRNGKNTLANYGFILKPYDSVVVTFDDTIRITHVKFGALPIGAKFVLFSSERSISNPDNYEVLISEDSNNFLASRCTYTFIEQDYLDAK